MIESVGDQFVLVNGVMRVEGSSRARQAFDVPFMITALLPQFTVFWTSNNQDFLREGLGLSRVYGVPTLGDTASLRLRLSGIVVGSPVNCTANYTLRRYA